VVRGGRRADTHLSFRTTAALARRSAPEWGALISERTKAGLAAAKARGVVLGGWKGGPKVNGRLGAEAQRRQA
jgi:hypothetical protein